MLRFHRIELHNFRSYRGDHSFDFPTESGLYFLTGSNNAALGSNGAGKSTFLDAITWCLYGTTTRGLRSNDVVSWGLSGCQVTLDLTVGSVRFIVKRTHKPISLTINGKPVDQVELEKHIRLNFASFLFSVINTQFGQSFLALSPAIKLTLFSDILKLDLWLKKSDEAATVTKRHEATLATLQTTVDKLKANTTTYEADVAELCEQVATFNDSKNERLVILQNRKEQTIEELALIEDRVNSFKQDKKGFTSELNLYSEELKKITPQKNKLSEEILLIQSKQVKLNNEIQLTERQIEGLAELTTDCPTCLQEVRSTYLAHERGTLAAKQEASKAALAKLGKAIAPLIKEKTALQAATDNITDQTEALWKSISDVELQLAREPIKHTNASERLKDVTIQIKGIKAEVNPHSKMLAQKEERLWYFKAQLKETLQQKTTTEELHAATSYWIKGFKRIRLFIIEQAFQTLEIEVNNSLALLGMDDWQITFDVERENKSGGITKGFIVFVKSPQNIEPVRWESWSGGETQRLELAADLGLANLILTQNGLNNTAEFFDEPSTHLSKEGMADLANLLYERAMTEGKCIWIVDHTAAANFGEFNAVITIRKDSNGSSITSNHR